MDKEAKAKISETMDKIKAYKDSKESFEKENRVLMSKVKDLGIQLKKITEEMSKDITEKNKLTQDLSFKSEEIRKLQDELRTKSEDMRKGQDELRRW